MKTIRTALLGTALLAALPAMAQPAPPAAPLVPGAGPRQAPPGHGPMGRTRGPAAMFAVVDANGDGRVVIDEVWTFTQARFADADRNHDGALVLEEALALRLAPPPPGGAPAAPGTGQGAGPGTVPGPGAAAGRPANPMQARMTAMMFRAVDADRDGRVTLAEIRPAVEMRFRGLDANGDNGVTLDELPAPSRHGAHRGPGPHGRGHGGLGGGGPAGGPEAPPPPR